MMQGPVRRRRMLQEIRSLRMLADYLKVTNSRVMLTDTTEAPLW